MKTLLICEGYSTGASLSESTGYPVAVAFNAGNLLAVGRKMRGQFPDAQIIFAADDDFRTDGNPGLRYANEAAQAVAGIVAVPCFGDARPEGMTDFNDMYLLHGPEAVAKCIADAIEGGGQHD